ncbi:MAG: tannase/feruloyl esterase family alpha/beta hydrolase [Deltaproteobacteria bacterium]|nr:tannase/feruloyl esterase family alpha/beta hydrolase [Deltaproteobacteria bacterium]
MQNGQKNRFIFTLLLLAALFAVPNLSAADACMPCESLLTVDFGADVTIMSAALKSEIEAFDPTFGPIVIPTPPYCDVRGVIAPAQGFNVKLPIGPVWNNRLYVVGNGVAAGSISELEMIPGLMQGFATAGTDTGHQGDMLDWSFGYNPPDNSNPDAAEKLIDYCEESIHETTVLSKTIIDTFYCTAPAYSYYVGCSTGGRQGLMEAQVYPEDFDGILVGALVHKLAEIQMRGLFEGLLALGPGAVDVVKLPLLAAAVMDKCDSIDGLVDGLIDNPTLCDFDARIGLPACVDDVDGMDCFTVAQRETIHALYDGPRNSAGELLTPGEAFGSEAIDPLTMGSGWIPWVVWPGGPYNSLSALVGIGAVQYIGLDPAPGPFYNFTTFNFDTDWPNVMDNLGAVCNADDPDLSAFHAAGGKLIHYDGWADPVTGPHQSYEYFKDVLATMGEAQVDDFYKLYMIPGMAHCGGGTGCYDTNALFAALMGWVEAGIEPNSYTGTRADGQRTRPMCPHPKVARYLGAGSIDDAASFTCVKPVAAKVKVNPCTIDLSEADNIVVKMTTTHGFSTRGWNVVAVVAQGALAEHVVKVPTGRKIIARFNAADLINISAGGRMAFTVTAILEKDGARIALEGSDMVRVK